MLEGAVEMPPDLVRRTDDGVTHDAGLAGGVQLVVLEVRRGVGHGVFAVQRTDGGFFARQQGRCSSGTVVAGCLVDHESDLFLIRRDAHHPQGTTALTMW